MQLKSVGKEKNDMFTNYLEKTYKKTATLMANSCKAVREFARYTYRQLSITWYTSYFTHFHTVFYIFSQNINSFFFVFCYNFCWLS